MTDNETSRSTERARILKALAHPTREFIVEKLSEQDHCVSELTKMIGADTSTISKHLAVLKNAGIVEDRKEGQNVYYHLTCPCIINFIHCLESIIKSKAARLSASIQE